MKFIIGDIHDFDSLNEASRGVNIGIFAASMKQIEACERNPLQAIRTISIGAVNSKKVSIENGFDAGVFVSTDKACSATTIYGACKYVGEQAFLNEKGVKLNSCRYGNVANSTGSIIPVIQNAIKYNLEIELFSEEMTRFLISPCEAIALIEKSLLEEGCGVYVPKLQSIRIKDLFEIYKKEFGLKFKVSKPRPNEKIHESMFSAEESSRVLSKKDYF